MKLRGILLAMAVVGFTMAAKADLSYTFNTDAEGFQNVAWQATEPVGWAGSPGTVKQVHTAGGWQMMMTKEFSWGAGGGSANQQLEMRSLANPGTSRISFDLMINGTSFPAGAATWFQAAVVGNSDGTAGWTQKENIFTVSGWHNADDPTLLTMHFDYSFAQLGWQPGDTWFQFWTGANSDAAVPVNFFLDNVVVYAVPEPAIAGLMGLGLLLLALRRNRS